MLLRRVVVTASAVVLAAAPARAYIEELLPDVLDGTVEPGRVFDRMVGLADTRRATGRWPSGRR
jgi:hypothetical protein